MAIFVQTLTNMKKTLLLFVLLSSVLSAQPTLNSTDMYDVNYTFLTKEVDNPSTIDVTSTGANSTWNFANITMGTESNNTFLNPAGNPGSSNFPQSNLCQYVTSVGGNPGYTYLKSTSNAFSIDGVYLSQVGSETVSQLNPDMDIFRFPFTFNSSFTQPIGGTTTTSVGGSSYTYYREGSQTVICDGYGTLTTPLGTFTNVLRIKTIQIYSDSSYSPGNPQVFDFESTIYNWVSAQSKGVSLLSQTTFVFNGTESVSGTMSSLPTVGIEEASDKLDFNIFPNPAKDQLFIQLPAYKAENLTAEIFSITGQLIRTIKLNNQQSMPVNFQLEGMESGSYLLRLSDQKSSGIRRFIVM